MIIAQYWVLVPWPRAPLSGLPGVGFETAILQSQACLVQSSPVWNSSPVTTSLFCDSQIRLNSFHTRLESTSNSSIQWFGSYGQGGQEEPKHCSENPSAGSPRDNLRRFELEPVQSMRWWYHLTCFIFTTFGIWILFLKD